MAKISRRDSNKGNSSKSTNLTVEEQEAALLKARQGKENRKLYRHTIDVPADLASKIDEELKRTHQTKRGFWLALAESYFSKDH